MSITPSTDSLHLATKLIGSPYIINGKDPKGFDCWGLVWYFYKQIGKNISDPLSYEHRKTFKDKNHSFNTAITKNKFVKIEEPQNNCVVSFSIHSYTVHVGIWLEEEKACLHSCRNSGVVCEKLNNIKQKRGLSHNFYLWQK